MSFIYESTSITPSEFFGAAAWIAGVGIGLTLLLLLSTAKVKTRDSESKLASLAALTFALTIIAIMAFALRTGIETRDSRQALGDKVEDSYSIELSDNLKKTLLYELDEPASGVVTYADGTRATATLVLSEISKNEYQLFAAGDTAELVPFEESSPEKLQATKTTGD